RDLLKLLVDRIEIHRDEVRLVYKVPQNPFVLSPASRGFLQHCLSRQAIALGFSPRNGQHQKRQSRSDDRNRQDGERRFANGSPAACESQHLGGTLQRQ
ncbi:MAG: hypothetical protein NXI32_21060, partial [bacterium]|nr:hypothetical protein [bacterium]